MAHRWLIKFWTSLSAAGLYVGTLLFAASFTPSLLPRTFMTQGILSGACLAAGYGLGLFGRWLARYMEFPDPPERILQPLKYVSTAICAVIAIVFLWEAAEWQNSIRSLMGLPLLDSAHPLRTGLIAAATFILLLVIARLFRLVLTFTSARLHRFIPRRMANVLGVAAAVGLFWVVIEGILLRFVLRAADSSFQAYNELIEPETERPDDAGKTGSAASIIAWEDLGRAGREFVASGPAASDISVFWGEQAVEPIRVYVGLNAAETPEERAELALQELDRTAAFERSVLVIITPTGTGWIDPAAIDTLEYLHDGDVASVAVQYSYLTSWLSLLVEPDYGTENARALFSAVYEHWRELPEDGRPRLYLHGLSLGSLGRKPPRSCSRFSMIPITAHSGADRPSQTGCGSTSPASGSRVRPPGFRASATVHSYVSRTSSTRSVYPAHDGGRCASSTFNMQATLSHSSTTNRSTGVRTGWTSRAARTSRPNCAGTRS